MNDRTRRLLSVACATGAGALTRMSLERAWALKTGRRPAKDPTDPGAEWYEAVAWGAAAGLLAGVARTFARAAVPAAARRLPPPKRRLRRLSRRVQARLR